MTRQDKRLAVGRLGALVEQIEALVSKDLQVILVSTVTRNKEDRDCIVHFLFGQTHRLHRDNDFCSCERHVLQAYLCRPSPGS